MEKKILKDVVEISLSRFKVLFKKCSFGFDLAFTSNKTIKDHTNKLEMS